MARNLDELRAWLAPQLASGRPRGDGRRRLRRRRGHRRGREDDGHPPRSASRGRRSTTCAGCRSRASRSQGLRRSTPRSRRAWSPSTGRRPTAWTSTGRAGSTSSPRSLGPAAREGARAARQHLRPDGGELGERRPSRATATSRPSSIVDPAKAREIQDAVVAVAADLHCATGSTQDELDRAKNPILTSIRESERTNSYWMTGPLEGPGEARGPGLGPVAPRRLRVDLEGGPRRPRKGLPRARRRPRGSSSTPYPALRGRAASFPPDPPPDGL
jgi:hypothetical protein